MSGAHLVRFYRSDRALAGLVGRHIRDALAAGGAAVVVATVEHREAFDTELRWSGVDTAAARERGDLLMLDAVETLDGFLDGASIDPEAFRALMGALLRDASAGGRPVHVYGEMVAVLWDRDDVAAALELEDCWNALGRELPFDLLCAYRADSPAGEGAWPADARQRVCDLHTGVLSARWDPPPDHAAPASATFPPSAHAPTAARKFVVNTVRSWHGDEQFVADAGLVATELATNAVLHADSEFTVEVTWADGGLRVAVWDRSPVRPAATAAADELTSGRGMAIVEAVSDRWTAEAHGTGKVVWAELDPW